jgi:superfamily II DNA/RNA helicase
MSESIPGESAIPGERLRPSLAARIPAGGTRDADRILGLFLDWVADIGLEPYAAQEEALLEIMSDRHVVLGTPTGSGKTLVATALHFRALCEGERSFYAAPIKALTSEKFFALCEDFGPDAVGMLTGDASINHDAPIICCTTEVLANMALRRGAALPVRYVVLDEFHFYADRERGVAWQIPLITLRDARFLLMSATLGNTAIIEARLREFTGRDVAHVHAGERPVPLDFEYRETPLHETVEFLLRAGKSPIYVVNFTQRECAERAQGLTSANIASREEKRQIADALAEFRFDTGYGKELRRFVGHGIGVHHAGLLPKYRLLVERLAQQGLLKVIFGTDTLGVGVNIPIRTVLFTKLCKFDGEKVAILSVREFNQIAGRAGRKGFDDQGSVVCQAPEHVIENLRIAARAGGAGGRKRKAVKKRAPTHGFVPWNRDTFEKLIERPPELLESRFDVSHGMLVNVFQREAEAGGEASGYLALLDLVDRSHASDASKSRLRRRAAALFRSLRRAGIVEIARDPDTGRPEARVDAGLQLDFSLHNTLSLYLVDALGALDPESPTYPLEVLTLVEAILESPRVILQAQVSKAKRELLAQLKAEGVPYEDRIRQLEDVTHPKPGAEFIYATFHIFAETHPWVGDENIQPKSIAREIYEGYQGFGDYVRDYGLARSEGVLLRYLSQVHNALVKSVPVGARTDAVFDVIAFFRTLLVGVDSSLVEAWETLLHPELGPPRELREAEPRFDLAQEPRLLAARARSEIHVVVRALAAGDYAAAEAAVLQDPDDPWDADRFESALAPFFAEYDRIVFTPDARQARYTHIKPAAPRKWDLYQVLVDPEGDGLWAVEGEIDLTGQRDPEGPLVRLRRIGT